MKPRSIFTDSGAVAETERPPFATTTASYLGLTIAELQDELDRGRSPADVASSRGLPIDGLEAAILIEAGSHLRDAVADGVLDPGRAGALVAGLTAHVGAFVERPPPQPAARGLNTRPLRAAA